MRPENAHSKHTGGYMRILALVVLIALAGCGGGGGGSPASPMPEVQADEPSIGVFDALEVGDQDVAASAPWWASDIVIENDMAGISLFTPNDGTSTINFGAPGNRTGGLLFWAHSAGPDGRGEFVLNTDKNDADIVLRAGQAQEVLRGTGEGADAANLLLGRGDPETDATNGYVYIPTMDGMPLGTPADKPGFAPIVVDRRSGRLWVYTGTTWKSTILQ